MTEAELRTKCELLAPSGCAMSAAVLLLLADRDALQSAIRKHRDAHGDDRCWMDDETLYESLPEKLEHDRRVGDQAAMRANCDRYIECRTIGGHWPSYADLEAEIVQLKTIKRDDG